MAKRKNGELLILLQSISRSKSRKCIQIGDKKRPTVRCEFGDMNAARYVWFCAIGNPGDLFVLHKCDNDLCVNINHLYLGDQSQNLRDCFARGRHKPLPVFRGSKANFSKLTEKKVKEIRQIKGLSQQKIAQRYGVSQVAISCILLRKTWKHIT